jgi:hypothetical protein
MRARVECRYEAVCLVTSVNPSNVGFACHNDHLSRGTTGLDAEKASHNCALINQSADAEWSRCYGDHATKRYTVDVWPCPTLYMH